MRSCFAPEASAYSRSSYDENRCFKVIIILQNMQSRVLTIFFNMNECRYGQYLFGQHQFAEAMEHFAASSLDLPTILCLFPMIKIPNVGASKDLANVNESESGGPSPLGSLTPSTSETLEGK